MGLENFGLFLHVKIDADLLQDIVMSYIRIVCIYRTGFFLTWLGFLLTCFEESPAGAKQVLPGMDLFWHGLERAVGLVRSL